MPFGNPEMGKIYQPIGLAGNVSIYGVAALA